MDIEQFMTMLGLSDLQFALAIIGLLILISVAVLNLKYARARRKAKAASEYSSVDGLPREPSFGQGFAEPEERAEPSFGDIAVSMPSAPESFSIDPRIDCVITLRFDEGISGAEILEEINAWNEVPATSGARWMSINVFVVDYFRRSPLRPHHTNNHEGSTK